MKVYNVHSYKAGIFEDLFLLRALFETNSCEEKLNHSMVTKGICIFTLYYILSTSLTNLYIFPYYQCS